MNKILKIVLPLIIMGVIAFVIYMTQRSIDGNVPAGVEPFDFDKYIRDMVKSDLEDKPYVRAKEEYRRIYAVIKTEENIRVTDSSGNRHDLLNGGVADSCYRMAFSSYWDIYEAEVEGVFKRDWSGKISKLIDIKNEAEFLKKQSGNSRNDSLNRYIGYVNEFFKAERFANMVRCSSEKEYDRCVSMSNEYISKYPLRNNSSLVYKLREVPEKARKEWKNSIERDVESARKFWDDYNELYDYKEDLKNKIDGYNKKFSSDLISYDILGGIDVRISELLNK